MFVVNKLFFKLSFGLVVSLLLTLTIPLNSIVLGLSAEQRKLLDSGIGYYNIEEAQSIQCDVVGNVSGVGNTQDPALSLTFPALNNEEQVANNITSYIRDNKPDSPWLEVDQNIGQWLFEKSNESNVNPLLIVAIGKQENQFGTSDDTSVLNNNYFGMKETIRFTDPRIGNITPQGIQNSSYMGFSSPAQGIEFFVRYLEINTQGENRGPYAEVQNFYEYIAMHQAGQIAYPGDSLSGGDEEMDVSFSWDSNWNPLIYYENSIDFINGLTDLSLSPVPTRGLASAGCQAALDQGESGLVDPETGYAFPVDIENVSSGIAEGQTSTNHHDETPAYDIGMNSGNAGGDPVYAISEGEIDNISTQEAGWCHGIQFKSNDGYYYWYGHLNNLTVSEGDRVVAGQLVGYIAEYTDEHNCAGTSSGAHLHIDRGCVETVEGVATPQRGGDDSCRDPDFIPFLSNLYGRLKA